MGGIVSIDGDVDVEAVSVADIMALEAATSRARTAATTAAKAMDKRPEIAAQRARLDELSEQHDDANERLRAARVRLDGVEAFFATSHAPEAEALQPSLVHARTVVNAAGLAAGAAATMIAAARSATEADAMGSGNEGRELMPHAHDAHGDFVARAAQAVLAVDELLRAKDSEHRRAGAAALHRVDELFEAARRRYEGLHLRILPPTVTLVYPQRQGDGGGAPPLQLDAAAQPAQRAVGAVQEAGMKLTHAEAVRVRGNEDARVSSSPVLPLWFSLPLSQPMVDASSGSESTSLRHFAAMAEAADAAVRHAEDALADAVDAHHEAASAHERERKQRSWNTAVEHLPSTLASIDELTHRNRVDGTPADAGTSALRESVAAATEADAIVARVPKDHRGAVDVVAVSSAELAALEAATSRCRTAAAAAARAMDRRPALAAQRARLDELHAKHREASEQIRAARAHLDDVEAALQGSQLAEAPHLLAAVVSARVVIAAADKSGGAAATLGVACRTAVELDAHGDAAEGAALLPRVADAHADYGVAAQQASVAVASLVRAHAAEVRHAGELALQLVDAALDDTRRRFASLETSALPLTGTAQARASVRRPSVLDPSLPATQAAVAAVHDAGARISGASALRSTVDVSTGPEAPGLRSFSDAVASAAAAVRAAEVAIADAARSHEDQLAAREREECSRAWADAVARYSAAVASVDALGARNVAEGVPADAGSAALNSAAAAVAEADAVASHVRRDSAGRVDVNAVSRADAAALEAAAGRIAAAAAAAARAMDRRPELASLRHHLEELQAQFRSADERLAASHARLEAVVPLLDAHDARATAAVAAAHGAIDAADQAGAAAAAQGSACAAASERDATSEDGREARGLLPRVVASQADFDARVASAVAAVEEVVARAKAADVRRGGEAAQHALDERLAATKRRYDALDLRPLPVTAAAAYPQRTSQQAHGGAPLPAADLLDPAAPPTKRALAAVQDAGLKLVHADAVRVRTAGKSCSGIASRCVRVSCCTASSPPSSSLAAHG